jgi:GNAT superfamily N-acetyltransferase
MATTFTLLGPHDAPRFGRLLSAWHFSEGTLLNPRVAAAAVPRLVAGTDQGHTWLIERAGEAIGYVSLTAGTVPAGAQPRLYVSALYVAPAWRGRGIGSRALGFVGEVARWRGVRVVAFETAGESKHSQLLHRQSQRPVVPASPYREAVA